MMVDLHMHSRFSFDAQPDSVQQIVAAAIARGLSTIVISDHKDFFWKAPPMFLDISGVQAEIDAARIVFGDQIEILKGIELGEPHATPAAMDLLQEYPFDTVIGSLHAMPNDIDFYDMDYDQLDQDQLLRNYLQEVTRMVQHGGFDVLAHLDYPLRVMKREYNHPSFENYMEWVVPILQEVIRHEISLEINAASLFGWSGQVGPGDCVLAEYRRLGGRMISIGSDSHAAAHVGRGIPECIEKARTHGFHEVIVYRARRAHAVAIGGKTDE